jgi:hypothetical protein
LQRFLLAAIASAAFAQSPPKIGYRNLEEYCRENPKMPNCMDSSKWNLKGLNQPNPAYKPKRPAAVQQPPRAVRDWRVPMSAEPLPAGQAQAHFPHPSSGMLISVRPKALLESKLLANLAARLTGGETSQGAQPAVVLEEIHLAIGSTASGQKSILMMVSAPTAALARIGDDVRSKGITACFVDATTLLVGAYADVNDAVQRILPPKGTRGGAPSPLPGSAEIAKDADFWLAARREYAKLNQKDGTTAPGLTAGVTGITMGLRVREGLDLDVLLHTKDPSVADKLLADANREILRALNLEPAPPVALDFLKSLNAAKTPNGLSMKLSIKPEEIPAPLMEQLHTVLASLRDVLAKSAPPARTKPAIHVL